MFGPPQVFRPDAVQGVTFIEASLTYDLPESELAEAGTVKHETNYKFELGDPAAIDAYAGALAEHDAEVRAYSVELGRRASTSESQAEVSIADMGYPPFGPPQPQRPYIYTEFSIEPVKLLQAGMACTERAKEQYPELHILNSGQPHELSPEDLQVFADWFTQEAEAA